jgi:hypothetical protein
MNAPRLVVVSCALASLGACASSGPTQKPQKTESILEVLDRAESIAPEQLQGRCPAGAVSYCVNEVTKLRCSCQDPDEVRAWLQRSFSSQ